MSQFGWKLVVHGGAGIIEKSRITPEQDRDIRAGLDRALAAGEAILADGGSAIDAVEAAIRALEDDPNFNAGRGAVFTYDGRNELDAAIMDGSDRSAGAVTGVTTTRHPVSLARAVKDHSPHVLLRGRGADQFSREQGLEQVDNTWFATPERRRQLDEMKTNKVSAFDVDLKYGTVGAVALDANGHVAAATSTGGLTGKRWGRIGDSPIIGAGTYADDGSAAVSATGSGEYFIRALAAYQVAERVKIGGESLQQALDDSLADVQSLGGTGGMIAVAPTGEMAWGFITPGMYRGKADSSGRTVALYSDAEER
ncbi:MAG TPA: isoaspartyl peptidase/L-asparaginase [Sphingomicrobium sp.]|jgi:beta-aspartyl-peptidase (threonine type)|nr:isoaspartyl peptidase/L-asparaginase [Sphingomicrobium sp.]